MPGLVTLLVYYALVDIFVLITFAELFGSLAERIGLPAIVGEILAGILLGSSALGGLINAYLLHGAPVLGITAQNASYVSLFADFSIILVVFAAGLEGGLGSLRSAGLVGVLSAILGDLLSFALTFLVLHGWLGVSVNASLLAGVAMAATSTAVVASLLRSERVGRSAGGRYLLAVSAADDIVGLILFSVILSILGGTISPIEIGGSIALAALAWVLTLAAALALVRLLFRSPRLRESRSMPLLVVFVLVTVVVLLGFSGIVGAFIAGLAMSESLASARVREMSGYLLAIFGSLFFAVLGAEFDVHYLLHPRLLLLTLVLVAVAVVGKVVVISPLARLKFRSSRAALGIGFGAVPRGEIGLLVGTIGLAQGIFGTELFGAILFAALGTTILGGFVFDYLVRSAGPEPAVASPS